MLADIVLDDAAVSAWCARELGAPLGRVLFRSGHLSQVVGVELADGRPVVIKIRPYEPRLAGCVAVQAHLAQAGFPCPAPLVGPTLVRGLEITAETFIGGGTGLSPERGAQPFAALLARLIALAPDPADVPTLTSPPPWTAWDHPGPELWPDRDDKGRDLDVAAGPEWLDSAARLVRQRLAGLPGPLRIGHGDWESQNLQWRGDRPLAVHDWDSVIEQPEVAIVGLASAVWPRAEGPAGSSATVAQSADFLAAYQVAAGTRWTDRQLQDAWAAGLWVRLFDAKVEAADGGDSQLDRLAAELPDRLALAALSPLESGRP
jgi:hypothetical protein